MKNKDLEKIIRNGITEMSPNRFEEILGKCNINKLENKKETIWDKIHQMIFARKFRFSLSLIVIVFIFSIILFSQPNSGTPYPFTLIAIDVNPSVVLELDEDDKVINVIKNNEDADIIVGDMDLLGVDYNIALNALIGSMVQNGYISELTNSVLLSIHSDDEAKEDELMVEVSRAVNDVLTGNAIEGSVITQELTEDEDAETLAETLEISESKAELILDIIELDPRVTAEELAQMSINDLNNYLEAKNYVLDNVQKTGNASKLGYLTVEEAYQAALSELNLDETSIVEFEVELEQEDGVVVYQVEIETDTDEYKILIDAKEGTVVVEDEDEQGEDNFPADTMTETEVIAMVLEGLGIHEADVLEVEIEEEMDNGYAYYEIEFDYQGKGYELDVDAYTGEVLTNTMDDEGFDFEEDENEIDEEEDEEVDELDESDITEEPDESEESENPDTIEESDETDEVETENESS